MGPPLIRFAPTNVHLDTTPRFLSAKVVVVIVVVVVVVVIVVVVVVVVLVVILIFLTVVDITEVQAAVVFVPTVIFFKYDYIVLSTLESSFRKRLSFGLNYLCRSLSSGLHVLI